MNKSKFLKKSLAALLAILMVAAMIPLSAAAAVIDVPVYDEDGNQTGTVRDTITASQGTLEGEGDTWTVTLPYSASDNTDITVGTSRKDVDVFGAVGEADMARLSGGKLSVANMGQGASTTAVVELRDVEGVAVATYNFTVTKNVAVNDTTVTEAAFTYTFGGQTKTVKAVPDGNTITFKGLPWSLITSLAATGLDGSTYSVALTLANPTTGSENTFGATSPDNTPVSAEGKGTVNVTAQNGNTAQYNLVFEEAPCVESLTIDGVEATLKAGSTTAYEVTVPFDTTNGIKGLPIEVTTPRKATNITFTFGTHNTGSEVAAPTTNGLIADDLTDGTTDGHTHALVVTDSSTSETKTYQVTVNRLKNSDTKVKSLKVTAGGFEETGVVAANGDMTAVLANNTNWAAAISATLTMNGTIKEYSLNDGAVTPVGGITIPLSGLKQNNNVKIVAEDGTTNIYSLNLSADSATQDKPAVKGVTMKVGATPTVYTGVVNSTAKTVTFTMPAADETANKTLVNNGIAAYIAGTTRTTFDFEWELTPHTKINAYANNIGVIDDTGKATTVSGIYNVPDDWTDKTNGANAVSAVTANYFDDTEYGVLKTAGTVAAKTGTAVFEGTAPITTKVTLGANTNAEWTLKFVLADSEKESRLNSISFYNAAKKADVTEENTYKGTVTQSNKQVTVAKEIPHAIAKADSTQKMTVEFDVSKGAKLYYVINNTVSTVTADRIYSITASGFDSTTGKTKFQMNAADLVKVKKFVVISEDGLIGSAKTVITGIVADTTAESKKYDFTASTGDLKDLTADKYTEYTAKITKADESQAADLISVKSVDGAVVGIVNEAGSVEIVVPETYVVEGKETEFDLVFETSPLSEVIDPVTNKNVIEGLKVVANDDGTYSLKDGSTTISKITVRAENTNIVKNYTVTVSAKTLSSDNSLSGVTVKGEAATEGEDNAWTVELPYGTDLDELTADDVVAAVADEAEAAVVKNEDGTYTITVKAENGQTAEYTLTVTVADEPVDPDNPFTDIGDPNDPANWSAKSIITAAQNGWILGMGNGQFNPKGQMSRAQFALIIARIKAGGNDAWEEIAGDYTTDVYTDVSASNSYMNAIAYVTAEGIMGGKGAGKFDPNGTITRQEAAKVMAVAAGLEQIPGNTVYADDASIAGWAKPFVNAVTENNIMNGGGSGFNPNQKLTREMGATILVRAFAE